jgi:2-dehydro-3-deoxy-D-gluconate 5-dehydrogenase
MGILERFRLDGRLALITGSATGLGSAIAIALAEAGASVACHGNRRPADATTDQIRSLQNKVPGCESRSFSADLGDLDSAEALYEAVCSTMGAPDILVIPVVANLKFIVFFAIPRLSYSDSPERLSSSGDRREQHSSPL